MQLALFEYERSEQGAARSTRPTPRPKRERGLPMPQDPFEAWLQERGWPYVAIDEAKKAIFATTDIESFDYLVYSEVAPNLLVLLSTPEAATDTVRNDMIEWEKLFGRDFRAVYVWGDPREQWQGQLVSGTQERGPLTDWLQ